MQADPLFAWGRCPRRPDRKLFTSRKGHVRIVEQAENVLKARFLTGANQGTYHWWPDKNHAWLSEEILTTWTSMRKRFKDDEGFNDIGATPDDFEARRVPVFNHAS